MVVAFGALDANAGEELGEVGGEVLGRDADIMHEHGVEIGGAAVDVAAGAGDLIGNEFIERTVLCHLIVDPFVVDVGGFDIGGGGCVAAAFNAEHFGPEVRPKVGETVAFQEAINEGGALVFECVRDELLVVLGGGQSAAEIQEDAAEEGFVIANFGGEEAKLLQAVVDDFVDVVVRDGIRPLVVFVLREDDDFGADGEAIEAGEDVGVATAGGGDDAVFIDLGGGGIVGGEEGEVGDITLGAVRVAGGDGGLLGSFAAFEDEALGGEGDLDGLRDGCGIVGSAGGDPVEQGLVVLGIGLEELATGVRDLAGGFEEHEALLGSGEIDATADHFLSDAVVVAFGIVAEEGEHEAVFAAGGTVAGALVAA